MGTAGVLGIVLVNYGSHELIADNLPRATVNASGAVVVVVDNYHSVAERTSITQVCREREWQLVSMPDNAGFAKAVNVGVREAAEMGCSVVLLLNPDAVVTAEVLTELTAEALRRPLALIGPLINDSDGHKHFHGSTVDLATGQIKGGWIVGGSAGTRMNWLSAACLAFHLDAYRAAGGMSEDYFLYWEDVDFSVRALKAGGELIVRRDLTAVHDEGGTQNRVDSRAKSPLYYYYNTRNRLVFGNAHAPNAARRRWLLDTPRQSYRIWLRGGRRQVLSSPQGLVAAIRGTMAGVRIFLRHSPNRRAQ